MRQRTPLAFSSLRLPHRLQDDPPAGVSGAPTDNNIMLWNAVIFGWAVFGMLQLCSLGNGRCEFLECDYSVCLFLSLSFSLPFFLYLSLSLSPSLPSSFYSSLVRPKDTPFEDGTFKLTIQFSEEYPNKPPIVRFVSKMFHPNGENCRHFSCSHFPFPYSCSAICPFLHSNLLPCHSQFLFFQLSIAVSFFYSHNFYSRTPVLLSLHSSVLTYTHS